MRRSRRVRQAKEKAHGRASSAAAAAAAAEAEAGLAARVAALEAEGAALDGALRGEEAELYSAELCSDRAEELYQSTVRMRKAAAQNGNEVAEAKRQLALHRALQVAKQDPAWRDWAGGLPAEVLAKVAEAVVAQNGAGWAAHLKVLGCSDQYIQGKMAKRKRDGNCLFVFARVCKEWRKAQLEVRGPLRTRVESDVIVPGRVALAKWALAEGCPGKKSTDPYDDRTLADYAAWHGHLELVQWLIEKRLFEMNGSVMRSAIISGNLKLVQWLRGMGCQWYDYVGEDDLVALAAREGHLELLQWLIQMRDEMPRGEGLPLDDVLENAAEYGHLELLRWLCGEGCFWNLMDEVVMSCAAKGGHLEVLQWLRAEGCPWDANTCYNAVRKGHVEVLRWARENGSPWWPSTRDKAFAELGYTDDLGNLAV